MKNIILGLIIFNLNLLSAQGIQFRPEKANVYIKHLDIDAQRQFVKHLIATNFENRNDLENWLVDFLQKQKSFLHEATDDYIINLFQLTDNSTYFSLVGNISKQVIHSWKTNGLRKKILAAAAHRLIISNINSGASFNVEELLTAFQAGVIYNPEPYLKSAYFRTAGLLHEINFNPELSLACYNKAIQFIDPRNKRHLSLIYENIANLYLTLELYNYAEKTAIYNITSFLSADFDANLNTIALVRFRNGDLQAALKIFKHLLVRSKERKDLDHELTVSLSLAQLHTDLNDFTLAGKYIQRAKQISKILNLSYAHVQTSLYYSYLLIKKGDLNEAEKIILQVKKNFNALSNPDNTFIIYGLLLEIYEKTDRINQAHQLQLKLSKVDGNLRGKQILTLFSEIEIAKLNEKNTQMAHEINYTELVRKRNRSVLIIVLIFATMLIWISYIAIKRKHKIALVETKNRQNQLQNKLEARSRERMAESIRNVSIANVKDDIKNQLDRILKELPRAYHDRFKTMRDELKKDSREQFIDEFEQRFQEANMSFGDKLKKLAHDITVQEERLCNLIKLNMSSKDIAFLINRSVGTVDNARSKIRKKLDLADDENLTQFLNNL